ncbi:replication initiation regulator SeqA [Pasteurellaceae bacterium Pebbles2]|nr:replication initiation regulator SeqA [Pasteurellaceae bacterium Pebbles2]
MKIIEVDEELYQYIASHTQSIGESASDILRRLLNLSSLSISSAALEIAPVPEAKKTEPQKEETKKETAAQNDAATAKSAVQNHDLFANEANTPDLVLALLNDENFKQENKAVSRFLSILTALYQTNTTAFAAAISSETVQGRTRLYFAQDEKTLLEAGNHTKPKAIPNSPYWVITNNNSGRKMIMLEGVMREMGLPQDVIDDVKNAFVGA